MNTGDNSATTNSWVSYLPNSRHTPRYSRLATAQCKQRSKPHTTTRYQPPPHTTVTHLPGVVHLDAHMLPVVKPSSLQPAMQTCTSCDNQVEAGE